MWRFYAGISDYPHYDAYRITAPSTDSWFQYERWGESRVRWGSSPETIGEMSRSLRELNRPRPTAYGSQGPHDNWAVYVVTSVPGERERLEALRQELIAGENAVGFDPGRNPDDLAVLPEMLGKK